MDAKLFRRCGLSLAFLLVGFLFAGCGDSKDQAADQAEAVNEAVEAENVEDVIEVAETISAAEEALVTQIAAIAAALDKAPAAAATILEKYGMTAQEYEDAIYKIASNPTLSAAFEKAKGH